MKAGTDPEAGAYIHGVSGPGVVALTLQSEYKFAKYNVQPNVYAYSQEEYQRLLAGTLLFESRSCVSDIAPQIKNGPKKRRTTCLIW